MKYFSRAILAAALFVLPVFIFAQFNMGDPSMMQGFPGAGGEGMMGGFPEGGAPDMEAMQQQQQKMMAKQLPRMVQQMKRGFSQLDRMFAKVKASGYPLPADVEEAYNNAKEAITVLENATEFDEEVQSAIEDFGEAMDIFSNDTDSFSFMMAFPKMVKSAERELGKLEKRFGKVKSRLANVEFDLTSALSDVEQKLKGLRTALFDADAKAKAGDYEAAGTLLEETFFEGLEDAHQAVGMLDALKNIQRAVKGVQKGITTGLKVVKKVEAEGLDATKLREILSRTQAGLDQLKVLVSEKDFDAEEAFELLESFNDLRSEFEDALDELIGEDWDGGALPSLNFSGTAMPKQFGAPDLSGQLGGLKELGDF